MYGVMALQHLLSPYHRQARPLITVTVSDANGCQASTSVIVTVNPLPTPAITGNTVICSGASTTLAASGGTTYVWSNGATTSAITVSPTSTTTYNVTVTDANGCQASTSVTVSVLTLPSTIITGNIEVCIGGSTKLTASGGNTYLWNTGATTSMITVSPIVQTQYSVTVSDSNGCSSNSSVTVEVVPLPQASITGNLIICHGGSTSLTASGGTGYLWSNGATTAGIDVSPLINTTYTVTVTNSKGCTATKSVLITVNPLPLVSITGNNTVCQDAFTKLTATGGGTYLWSNGETTSMISVNPSSAMSYIVTVTTAAGCSATASINVTVKPKPTINLVGIDKICKGDSSVIVATGYSNNPCPGVCNVTNPILLAHWNLNACASVMSQGTHMDYSEFKPIVNSSNCTSVTAGNVHRLGTNKHSCTPGPNGSIGMCIGSQKTCNPGKADFSQALRFEVTINPNQSSHLTGLQFYEQAPEMYSWVNGPTGQNNYATKFLLRVSKNGEFIYYEDSISTHRTWGLVDFDFSSNPNFQSNVTSKYLFELVPYCTVNNGAVESVWDIDEIKVFGGCCAGTSHEISSYLWSNGDTGTSITVKPTVTTNYTVTVTDCCGCSSEENYLVTVNCLMADLGPDKMINLGQTVTLTPVITGNTICNENDRDQNGVKYLWSNGATTSSITVTPSTSTFFRVTVTDCNDCQDTESISIHVMMGKPIITYPNPASDRINIASESDIDAGISVKFYTVDGKKVLVDNPEIIFNNYRNVSVIIPNQLSDGIYFLEIRNGDKVYTEKIILLQK
ncbi:MAG: T9SS type A sorting domain-containing protein [Saprospiraceae bacterium]|nr:T9SS type A sorting domain-containing protein [Saprospiraceae bacterium]